MAILRRIYLLAIAFERIGVYALDMLAALGFFVAALPAFSVATTDPWIVAINAALQSDARKEFAAAETGYRYAAATGGSPSRQAISLNSLGTLYVREGRFADGERCYLQAIASAARSDDPRIARRIAGNLAALYLETGQFTRAEHTLLAFSSGLEVEPLDTERVSLLSDLASLRAYQHRYADAENLFRKVIDGLARAQDRESLHIRAVAMGDLSELLVRTGRTSDAAALARECFAILESLGADSAPDVLVKATTNLALFAAAEGNTVEAEMLFRKAIGEAEATFGPESYLVGAVLRPYGAFLRKLERRREARDVERRSTRILSTNQRENALDLTVEASALSRSLLK